MRIGVFETAPGGKLPDIEAVVSSCEERNEESSAVFRVTEVWKTYYDGKTCSIIETNIKPKACAFKSDAKELAANVSANMLRSVGCKEGDWRTITEPCPWEEDSAASLQRVGFVEGWALFALPLAVSSLL